MLSLFEKIFDKNLLSRRINVVAARVKERSEIATAPPCCEQPYLFTDYTVLERLRKEEAEKREKSAACYVETEEAVWEERRSERHEILRKARRRLN